MGDRLRRIQMLRFTIIKSDIQTSKDKENYHLSVSVLFMYSCFERFGRGLERYIWRELERFEGTWEDMERFGEPRRDLERV